MPTKTEIGSLLFSHLSVILGFCLGFWLVARILRQHLRPSVSIAWLMSIILIPYVGVPAYFLLGGRKLARRARKKMKLYPKSGAKAAETAGMDRVEHIMVAARMPPIRRGGRIEFVSDGKKAYETMLRLIRDAKQSIHIVTFILARDELGASVVERLAEKATEGVQVRLLLDALGCFTTRWGFVQPLRNAGGKVGIFSPVLPLRKKWSANLRNHRKILIVDGRIAMVGGMNIGREYMGSNSDSHRWLDSTLLLEGDTVGDLNDIFRDDWNFSTKKEEWIGKSGSTLPSTVSVGPSAQIAASGPDVPDEPIHDAILTACMNVKERIWIVTPYFIPDEGIEHAILLQARMGKDVRILLPKHSDHFIADLARRPSLRRMKECGVKIFLYPKGMIHAKYLIVDDDLALAGSMNFDMRSLYLNYEIGVFIRSPEEIKAIAEWMQFLMDRSVGFVKTKAGHVQTFLEDLSLLISPLL